MTDVKDETLEVVRSGDAMEMIDLGDAVQETKQQWSGGMYPDCYVTFGTKWGCGG